VSSTITVDTVERFQGSQRDVIIYGTAVATSTDLRTITSETRVDGRVVDRKLNVACTRARQQFIMLGHPEILSQSESYAEALRQLPWVHLQDRIDLPYGRS
jgi:superfamily I DNA and/or RNA helicase